jgi:unsaturated rhamnogalacturonyl hydrolase
MTDRQLAAAADLLAGYPFPFWHYGDSVGFEGLLAAGARLATDRYEGFVYGALKAWAARRTPFRELDNTAPGHALCLAYERSRDDELLEAGRDLAGFLTTRRTASGTFVSFERAPLREPYGGERLSNAEAALLQDPGAGVFVDCLHFDPPFFAHLGALTDDAMLIDLAAQQALAYVELLQDDDGLFWHFWLEQTGRRYGRGWGRGQGWALLGLLDTLTYLPRQHALRPPLETSVLRLARALESSQQRDGGWASVVGESASGSESSTAAFVASGLAAGMARSLLPAELAPCARAAWESTLRNVDTRGVLTGVTVAVWASTAASHYRSVPIGSVMPWGQGPLLLAAHRMGSLAGSPNKEPG